MGTNNLKSGDFFETTHDGNIVVGVVKGDRNLKGEDVTRSVQIGPDLVAALPESRLTRLGTKDKQLEAAERERRQSLLQVAISLMNVHDKAAWTMSRIEGGSGEIPKPNTGIFVAVGVYAGNGPHMPYCMAVSAEPSLYPEQVAQKLWVSHPNGFGMIPCDSRELPKSTHGKLVNYWCYELPKSAAALVDWQLEKVE